MGGTGLEPVTLSLSSCGSSDRTEDRLSRFWIAGAHAGARLIKLLQIGMFVEVSKAVRRHWRLEGSNPSPSVKVQKPHNRAVSGPCWSTEQTTSRACPDNEVQDRLARGWCACDGLLDCDIALGTVSNTASTTSATSSFTRAPALRLRAARRSASRSTGSLREVDREEIERLPAEAPFADQRRDHNQRLEEQRRHFADKQK
jgi:hypothetical protein